MTHRRPLHVARRMALLTLMLVAAWSSATAQAQAQTAVSFSKKTLVSETSARPTSLQWGPDGRLYVASQSGIIKAYTVNRSSTGAYSVTGTEQIVHINAMPNRNDDGSASSTTGRLVTGIVVTGTATSPVIYVGSSDPRIGAGPDGADLDLDTNSGIISKLTKSSGTWIKQDLVRGLPRSEENHTANGLALSPDGQTLFVAQGGNTNKGAPSNNFANLPEYALSAAILSVNLAALPAGVPYDLPTLDDETRAGTADSNDPFGGNDGKNQAKLVPNGPVQVYSPGFRNPYDVLVTSTGKLFSIDNGGNSGWGDVPVGEGPGGTCTNGVKEPGTTERDSLHAISGPGYYGGHPNPTRGNVANKFNSSNPQSPVSAGNAIECDFRSAGDVNGAGKDETSLVSFGSSTNGLAEYTASNFGSAMKGNLIAASYDNTIQRLVLNGVTSATKSALATSVGAAPLDVTTVGDTGLFPGTIWVADVGTEAIYVLEPSDYSGAPPTGCNTTLTDSDGDGYSNNDEAANGTDPCSAASKPADFDGDKVSDLTDANDDNDALADKSDPFARDANNGLTTAMPVSYLWENESSDALGGFFGLGFTGLMTNGVADYLSQFDPEGMTTGGAAGVVTVDEVDPGDAYGATNSQRYGFQFGVKARPADGPFTVRTRIVGPFKGITPANYQSMGLFIGTGDQNNYVKLTTAAVGGTGVQVAGEVAGVPSAQKAPLTLPGPDFVDLYLRVDPSTGTVQPSYTATTNGTTTARTTVGSGPITVPLEWFTAADRGLAVGIISTSTGSVPFPATWDFMEVTPDTTPPPPPPAEPGLWQALTPSGASRQEVAFTQVGGKLYLGGGTSAHQVYDPATKQWSSVAPMPQRLDHVQSVALNGKIYYIGGLTGWPGPATNAVSIYDPATNTFSSGAPMPRARGGGGVAVANGKIYYAGGLANGAAVNWFDEYDPATNTWRELPNMPTTRDHFHAVVLDGKFWAIGGRNTQISATTKANEAFSFSTGQWTTGYAPLPTARGGFAAAAHGDEVLVIGGEDSTKAHATVEAYNVKTNAWRPFKPMPMARHGIQAATCNGGIYIAAGNALARGDTSSVASA